MKRILDQRSLVVIVVCLAAAFLAVGCTTRPQESETISVSGNHSTGQLSMVTADTSSDGYQYLEPSLSPDGTRIVFSADWLAVPPEGQPPDVPPLIRQLAIVPLQIQAPAFEQRFRLNNDGSVDTIQVPVWPQQSVLQSRAALVELANLRFTAGTNQITLRPNLDWQKGDPIWLDDATILFWLQTPRGSRLYRSTIGTGYMQGDVADCEILYREPDDNRNIGWKTWEHLSPSMSPDGRWVAFMRYGHTDADSLSQATDQSIWVINVPPPGSGSTVAIQVTEEATVCDFPSWSPDGTKLVFQATLDIIENHSDYYAHELFTVDFDTTGYAAGAFARNRNLTRLTFSPPSEGSNTYIRNMEPVYSPDGTRIAFVSDRRVPTITLTERNIWWIPSDGSLEPALLFFTRADDINPVYTGRDNQEILLSSSLGFPTELLDAHWQMIYDITASDPDLSSLNRVQLEAIADAARDELAYFEGVMSHLYLFTDY